MNWGSTAKITGKWLMPCLALAVTGVATVQGPRAGDVFSSSSRSDCRARYQQVVAQINARHRSQGMACRGDSECIAQANSEKAAAGEAAGHEAYQCQRNAAESSNADPPLGRPPPEPVLIPPWQPSARPLPSRPPPEPVPITPRQRQPSAGPSPSRPSPEPFPDFAVKPVVPSPPPGPSVPPKQTPTPPPSGRPPGTTPPTGQDPMTIGTKPGEWRDADGNLHPPSNRYVHAHPRGPFAFPKEIRPGAGETVYLLRKDTIKVLQDPKSTSLYATAKYVNPNTRVEQIVNGVLMRQP